MPLTVRGLRLRQGRASLIDGLDLDLGPVGCTMVLGPNGAGKSLLLKLMHGLIPPYAGQIDWNGAAAGGGVTRRPALVFQSPVLPRRSVAANLDFVLRARGGVRARRDALPDHVGLAAKAAQPARFLSGGEQQRLALATPNAGIGMGGHAMTDQATLISFGNKQDCEIVVEGDTDRFNEYGMIPVSHKACPSVNFGAAKEFADWLLSPSCQEAIVAYEVEGQQLLFPNAPADS